MTKMETKRKLDTSCQQESANAGNREAQAAFAGEAERVGIKDDEDIMAMIKEMRQESVVK